MRLYLALLAFVLLGVFAYAAETDDQAYRESQEAYQKSLVMAQKSDAAYQKERRIVAVCGGVVICGLILFFMIPMQRRAAKSVEVAIETKKVLEEIRELLRKTA